MCRPLSQTRPSPGWGELRVHEVPHSFRSPSQRPFSGPTLPGPVATPSSCRVKFLAPGHPLVSALIALTSYGTCLTPCSYISSKAPVSPAPLACRAHPSRPCPSVVLISAKPAATSVWVSACHCAGGCPWTWTRGSPRRVSWGGLTLCSHVRYCLCSTLSVDFLPCMAPSYAGVCSSPLVWQPLKLSRAPKVARL